MKNSSRLSLRLQIRSFKNTFFQLNDLPFNGLFSDSLIEAIKLAIRFDPTTAQG